MAEWMLNNLLAILWLMVFLKAWKEQTLQVTHFLLLIFAIGIFIHSAAEPFT